MFKTVLDELIDLSVEAHCVCVARTDTYSKNKLDKIKLDYTAVGMAWAAILSKHYGYVFEAIPPHVTCLMMASLKGLRSALGSYHRDNYVDSFNYLAFASRFQQEISKDASREISTDVAVDKTTTEDSLSLAVSGSVDAS